MEDERFGWLWEYAAAHGLKLQWLDDAIYQPRFEARVAIAGCSLNEVLDAATVFGRSGLS
jgi:hypothetical protein